MIVRRRHFPYSHLTFSNSGGGFFDVGHVYVSVSLFERGEAGLACGELSQRAD